LRNVVTEGSDTDGASEGGGQLTNHGAGHARSLVGEAKLEGSGDGTVEVGVGSGDRGGTNIARDGGSTKEVQLRVSGTSKLNLVININGSVSVVRNDPEVILRSRIQIGGNGLGDIDEQGVSNLVLTGPSELSVDGVVHG